MGVMSRQRLSLIRAALRRLARGRGRRDSGAVSPVFALMLVPILGGLGMATEASSWYLTQRAMQNAADTAAIAAATNNSGATNANGCTVVGDFCFEAKAAAGRLGYANGVSNVTVTPVYMTNGCPGSLTECYKVTIIKNVPLSLLQVVGYTGTPGVTVSGAAHAQQIQVVSIARPKIPIGFCMGGLEQKVTNFTIDGGSNVDFGGCNVFSNGSMKCNGANSDNGMPSSSAKDTTNCGVDPLPNQGLITDPFSNLHSSIPTGLTCSTTAINKITDWSKPVEICSSTPAPTGITNITQAKAELIVFNTSLNLNNTTLETTGSGSLTIIFSGTTLTATKQTPAINQSPTGAGTIDIAAPNSGDFKGVAIMDDSTLTGSGNDMDWNYSGNNPTLKVQGLIYLPNAAFQISGAIDLHSNGLSCVGVIAQTIRVSGTGSLFNEFARGVTTDCPAAGLTLPSVPNSGANLALVQ
jgi:Flp pilus assembly protein TadG